MIYRCIMLYQVQKKKIWKVLGAWICPNLSLALLVCGACECVPELAALAARHPWRRKAWFICGMLQSKDLEGVFMAPLQYTGKSSSIPPETHSILLFKLQQLPCFSCSGESWRAPHKVAEQFAVETYIGRWLKVGKNEDHQVILWQAVHELELQRWFLTRPQILSWDAKTAISTPCV